MAVLNGIVEPDASGAIDLQGPIVLPALDALSALFSSLYHYHLGPDLCLRTSACLTHFGPEFLELVKAQEPRAVALMGWWFVFVRLISDNIWFYNGVIPSVLHSVSNVVRESKNLILMGAVEKAVGVVRLAETKGREEAAKSVFEGWEGVYWDAGGGKTRCM
jgi:hypothetical protein